MAVGKFHTVTGGITLGTAGFALSGDNAGFCDAILNRTIGGVPLRLESLTYVLPTQRGEDESSGTQQPLVVNLLTQLNTYYNQSNTFLRSQTALNQQLTLQLRQALVHANGTVRAHAGEIERAVRGNLYRDGEFKRAISALEKELKKNYNNAGENLKYVPSGAAAAGLYRQILERRGAAGRTETVLRPARPARDPVFRNEVYGRVSLVERRNSGGEAQDRVPPAVRQIAKAKSGPQDRSVHVDRQEQKNQAQDKAVRLERRAVEGEPRDGTAQAERQSRESETKDRAVQAERQFREDKSADRAARIERQVDGSKSEERTVFAARQLPTSHLRGEAASEERQGVYGASLNTAAEADVSGPETPEIIQAPGEESSSAVVLMPEVGFGSVAARLHSLIKQAYNANLAIDNIQPFPNSGQSAATSLLAGSDTRQDTAWMLISGGWSLMTNWNVSVPDRGAWLVYRMETERERQPEGSPISANRSAGPVPARERGDRLQFRRPEARIVVGRYLRTDNVIQARRAIRLASGGQGTVLIPPMLRERGLGPVPPASGGQGTVLVPPMLRGRGLGPVPLASGGQETVLVPPMLRGRGLAPVPPASGGQETVLVPPMLRGRGLGPVPPASGGQGTVLIPPMLRERGLGPVPPASGGQGTVLIPLMLRGRGLGPVPPASGGQGTVLIPPMLRERGLGPVPPAPGGQRAVPALPPDVRTERFLQGRPAAVLTAGLRVPTQRLRTSGFKNTADVIYHLLFDASGRARSHTAPTWGSAAVVQESAGGAESTVRIETIGAAEHRVYIPVTSAEPTASSSTSKVLFDGGTVRFLQNSLARTTFSGNWMPAHNARADAGGFPANMVGPGMLQLLQYASQTVSYTAFRFGGGAAQLLQNPLESASATARYVSAQNAGASIPGFSADTAGSGIFPLLQYTGLTAPLYMNPAFFGSGAVKRAGTAFARGIASVIQGTAGNLAGAVPSASRRVAGNSAAAVSGTPRSAALTARIMRSADGQSAPAQSDTDIRTTSGENQPAWAEAPDNTVVTAYLPQVSPAVAELMPLRAVSGGPIEQTPWGEREVVRRETAAVISQRLMQTRQHTETNRFLRFFREIFTSRQGRVRTRIEPVPGQTDLQHFSQPLETEYTLPNERMGNRETTAASVVYRRPAREQTPSASPVLEDSGEEILKQQVVDTRPAAVLQTDSYVFPTRQGVSAVSPELTREQEGQIAERVLGEINYNRLADELLDRVERRLRAERRKFGR